MDDFDNIKNKILEYSSPLNIDEEWNALLQKHNQPIVAEKKAMNSKLGYTLIGWILGSILIISIYLGIADNPSSELSIINEQQSETWENYENILKNSTNKKVLPTEDKKEVKSSKSSIAYPSNVPNDAKRIKDYIYSDSKKGKKNKHLLNIKNNQLKQNEIDYPSIEKEENTALKTKGQEIILDTINAAFDIFELESKATDSFAIRMEHQLKSLDSLLLSSEPYDKNFALFEALGQGGFYSLNYGRILRKGENNMTFAQIGLSLNPKQWNGNPTGIIPLLIPVSINQSFGLTNHHHLTAGLGLTLINDRLVNEPNDFYIMSNLRLGYQYQKKNSRFFYKVEILPSMEFGNIFLENTNRLALTNTWFWAGIGVGCRF